MFQLKENVSQQTISEREHHITAKVNARLRQIKNLFLLGNNELPKVAIYTFVIKSKLGKILHPNFVCSLLSDLFGIQSRAGCQCAAMYGQKVLGIDLHLSREYKDALMSGQELLRMGFTRVNFNYFFSDEDIDYILDAIEFVCEFGWLFLPHYTFDKDSGVWVNRSESEQKQRSWLGAIDYSSGAIQYQNSSDPTLRGSFPFFVGEGASKPLKSYVEQAKEILAKTVEEYKMIYGKSTVDQTLLIQDDFKKLIWFLFPSEVLPLILQFKYQSPLKYEKVEEFCKLLKSQSEEDWNTPFQPRDYNQFTHKFFFSKEYAE